MPGASEKIGATRAPAAAASAAPIPNANELNRRALMPTMAAESRDSAAIVGINARRFNSFAFGIGAGLAAAAGALVAPIFSLAPDMGVLPNIHAYVIVILGGMGSVTGSIMAGILLGESENLFTAFFPDPTRAFAYTNAFGVLVLMVVLVFRPQGLFGRRHLRME